MYNEDVPVPDGMQLHELSFTPQEFDAMFDVCREMADIISDHMADGVRAGVPYHDILITEMEIVSKHVAQLRLLSTTHAGGEFGVLLLLLTGMYNHAVDKVARDGN